MIKIGINGFGRIGRAITRINLLHNEFKLVAINDIDPDINNLAYLLKYDTTYGRLENHKVSCTDDSLIVDDEEIKVFCESDISDVPWSEAGVDIVIDSSGIASNVKNSHNLLNKGISKVLITHAPSNYIDFTYMLGINDNDYDKSQHHVISTSICDANAVAPFYKLIDDYFGVDSGEITTLHPWLSYQNLVDGSVKSVSSPGHYWKDYALGRNSVESLIPKDTSLCKAMENIFPNISEKLHATSFRTPTSIVSAADGVFLLKKEANIDEVFDAINDYCDKNPGVFLFDDRSLVSIDYLKNENAAVIDKRWLNVNNKKLLKFVLWYDNEWGYSYRVYNSINKVI